MIPNCFDDYDSKPAYNSVDASLWFIHAADLYLQATNDNDTWQKLLAPTICKILDAYESGTRFGIHADERGLIVCGDQNTQITWMDAQCNGQCFTPRPGAAVEVNALWHSVLRRMAKRSASDDPNRAQRYSDLADKAAQSLRTEFWNPHGQCLYDFVNDSEPNADLRPNQIFAVSLPCSALDPQQQKSVVEVVQRHLLTPFGLRSLDRENYQYRCSCDADSFNRDSAYHQGTVWAWLIGPFVEAHLKVHGFSLEARQQAKQMIQPLLDHLDKAGVGFISEIFDADPPHTPRGCIAQAWSVAELLRAHSLIFS
jgi:predicted glycogen debranching enzyme